MGKRIGDDRREATDWLQDRLNTTRPAAERAMIALLREGVAITTDAGILLTEEEEEAERKASVAVRKAMQSSTRNYFRHHSRTSSGLKPQNRRHSQHIIKTDYSQAADSMIQADDSDEED